MLIKFYREKNAKSIKGAKKRFPSHQELIENLILKLKEKINHIEVVKNKQLRDEYLKKKNKYELSQNMKESEIISLLMERVLVDIYELLITLSKILNIKTNFKNKKIINNINTNMLNELANIYNESLKNDAIQNLSNLLSYLLYEYNFSLRHIESQMKLTIKKEGSFEKGMLVIFE